MLAMIGRILGTVGSLFVIFVPAGVTSLVLHLQIRRSHRQLHENLRKERDEAP